VGQKFHRVGKTLPCEIIIPPRGKNIPPRGIKIPADGIFLESFVRTVLCHKILTTCHTVVILLTVGTWFVEKQMDAYVQQKLNINKQIKKE
jgi:hypothetical protein